MIRWRLDPEQHGSDGFTQVSRLLAFVGLFAALVVGAHLAWNAWYDGRVMPGVVASGHQLGGMSLDNARKVLQSEAKDYRLNLNVADQHYDLKAADLGATFDTEATLAAAYRVGRDNWVPLAHSAPVTMAYHLDTSKLQAFVTAVADKIGIQPVDATVTINGTKLTPVPDKDGWTVDKVGLAKLIESDLTSPGGAQLQVKPRVEQADIRAPELTPTIDQAKQLMATPITLTYNAKTYSPTPSDIGKWLNFVKTTSDSAGPKLVAQIDTSKVKSYVQTLANKLDVDSVNKLENVENGVVKVTQEGVNGTAIDQDPITAALAEAVSKQQPLSFAVTDHPVAFKTVSSNFTILNYPKYIEVNLSKQHLWVWQDGSIIFDSPITSGATGAGFPTVTGLFNIYYKTTNTHLIGNQYGPNYNYDVSVQYWMPFYSGYGLHDASWRNGNFGGQDYYYGGSHGCVNLPLATAAFVYNWSDVGTPVWVHK